VKPDYAGYHVGADPPAPGTIVSGAFNHGFKGLCSVFVTAAFSFAGTELVGLAAAEASNPRKSKHRNLLANTFPKENTLTRL